MVFQSKVLDLETKNEAQYCRPRTAGEGYTPAAQRLVRHTVLELEGAGYTGWYPLIDNHS